MKRSTTTATSSSTRWAVAPPIEHRWMSVIFLQGEEADAMLDLIGQNGSEAAIQHLSQWDYGDETRDAALVNGYVYDAIPQSPTDRVIRDDASGYALTYNQQFGYVSLLRHFDPIVETSREPVAPPARFGLEKQRPARRTNGLRL